MAGTKRKWRLGVWLRLCIVLTVLWLLGGTLWLVNQQAAERYQFARDRYDLCVDMNSAPSRAPRDDCFEQMSREGREYAARTGNLWLQGLGITAIGAALIWILGGIIYGTIRWILAGRRKPEEAAQ